MRIQRLSIEGRTLTATDGVCRLRPGAQRLQVEFAALSLAAPERVQFRWRIAGFDDRWSTPTTERQVLIHHLPAGHYRFEVTACNNDGLWSATPATLQLIVPPRFWETWWFRIGVVLLALGCAAGAGQLVARARLRRRLEQLERQSAVDRERARIARDIHDDLGSSLTHITLLSQSALARTPQSTTANDELRQIFGTARELTRAMDEIVWAVNPRHDSLDSLANFLGKYAQDYLRVAKVRCRLHLPANLPLSTVSAEVRHHVYLATKEALNNIVKHAGATEVRLALSLEHDRLRIEIEDDGQGFVSGAGQRAETARVGGHGLPNIERRLVEIGGEVVVDSRPGRGTKIVFLIPFTPESNPSPHE